MQTLSSHPPEIFKEAMCTRRNVGAGYSNLRMNSGSVGERATCSHFRPDKKWTTPQKNLEEGDIVILKDEGVPRNSWTLARVEATYPDADGYVRKVKVAVADRSRQSGASHYERPIHGLILLLSAREQ